jgi:hypothetical protein
VRTGRVLSVEFVNDGKSFQATWFQPNGRTPQVSNKRLLHAGRTKPSPRILITRGILTRQQRLFDALSPDFVAGANLAPDFSSSTGTPGTHQW